MKHFHFLIFLSTYLLSISFSNQVLGQKRADDKLGRFSRSNPFVFSPEEAQKYVSSHRFTPKNDKVKAYYDDGTFIYLPESAQIRMAAIFKGQFDNKKGVWIEFFSNSTVKLPHDSYYVFLNDLFDIEAQAKAIDEAESEAREAQKWGERWELIKSISPYALTIIGLIILIRGISSICPKCSAWWKRELERTESLGSSTYSGTRSVRKEVYGTESGGYVYVDEPYTKTTHHYRNHYRCKKCGHKWTVDKSS